MLQKFYNAFNDYQSIRNVYYKYLGSKKAANFHFGIDCLPYSKYNAAMFDLTTILLKWELEPVLKKKPETKCLEIGTGRYAILSGYLTKFTNRTIDTCELMPDLVESSKETMRRNNIELNIFQSDLFSNVPDGNRYDILFWNLPYYLDPEDYLLRVFQDANDYLEDDGYIAFGYNSKPLSLGKVEELLAKCPKLKLTKVKKWFWNLHHVVYIQKA